MPSRQGVLTQKEVSHGQAGDYAAKAVAFSFMHYHRQRFARHPRYEGTLGRTLRG